MFADWKDFFDSIKAEPYCQQLHRFLDVEYANNTIYPPRDHVFEAFRLTKPSELKVVIIGQDPYHEPGQAMGLSFSVPKGIPLPPSLINIYKEIESDIGVEMDFSNGDLTCWAKQGVLLLNAYLSVRAHQPLSHKREEYDRFIADCLNYLDTLDQPIVFLLWGGFAKSHAKYVNNPKHYVLSSAHPSPLSANRGGWFGCKHFSKTNEILARFGVDTIQWQNK